MFHVYNQDRETIATFDYEIDAVETARNLSRDGKTYGADNSLYSCPSWYGNGKFICSMN